MIKRLTCIECPQGCQLEIDVEGGHVIKVTGHKCPKGETYAKQEIEDPRRTLTTTVLSRGLDLKMVPVKTSAPIPKARLMEAMQETKHIRLEHVVKVNQVIVKDFLGLGVDLISEREASSQ